MSQPPIYDIVVLLHFGPLAQWLEQRTHNPLVVGSSPTWPIYSGFAIQLDCKSFFNAYGILQAKKMLSKMLSVEYKVKS